MDGAFAVESRSLNASLFGSGTGKIGRRASVSSAVLTLTDRLDARNFEVGMVIQASDTDGGGSLRSGSVTITKVDRKAGTLTANANWSTITSMADNDYLYQTGDYDLQLKGLEAWLPIAGPSSTAFFGVDRTVDSERLGGISLDISSKPIEEGVIDLVTEVMNAGGSPDVLVMNPFRASDLIKSLGSKVEYVNEKVGAVGFDDVRFHTPAGKVSLFIDRDCPADRCYALQMDTWCLESLGEATSILDLDGNQLLRQVDADKSQIRVGGFRQLSCSAPGKNGVGKLN